jgi:ATP-binding cassette, subfamily B, bacterial
VRPTDPHRRGQVRRFYAAFVRPYLTLHLEIGACLVLGVALSLSDPLILRAIIDQALGDGDRGAVLMFTVLLAVVFLFRAAFRLLSTWLYSYSGLRVLFDLRQRAFEHAQRLSPYFFRGERLGDILSRLTSDVDVLQQAAAHTVVNAASDALTILGIGLLLTWLDPVLTGLMAIVYPLMLLLIARINRRLRDAGGEARDAYGTMFAFLEERLAGVRLTQEFGRHKAEARGHVRASRPVIASNLVLSLLGAMQVALADLVNTVCFIIIFAVGGMRALDGDLTIGTLVAYYTLASRLYRPLSGLIEVNVQLQVARASLARVFELLDRDPGLPVASPPHRPAAVQGELALSRVGLRWDDGTRVLRDVSLSIEPGRVVALVGPTGSGKSTTAGLLCRYLDPTEGSVTLDGIDVRRWPLEDLRRVIGLVPQETRFFHDTLAANLRLARRRAGDAELIDALEVAGLSDLLAALPEGLDTRIGEQGHRLSGGERQRLALARMLLKGPEVIVLDEATSALDPRTERRVLAHLLRRVQGKTVVIIGHRLASLADSDRIFVLDGGTIAESGTHAELYGVTGPAGAGARGLYRRLYDAQMRQELEAEV